MLVFFGSNSKKQEIDELKARAFKKAEWNFRWRKNELIEQIANFDSMKVLGSLENSINEMEPKLSEMLEDCKYINKFKPHERENVFYEYKLMELELNYLKNEYCFLNANLIASERVNEEIRWYTGRKDREYLLYKLNEYNYEYNVYKKSEEYSNITDIEGTVTLVDMLVNIKLYEALLDKEKEVHKL